MNNIRTENIIAYLSMEIGIDPQIPSYAGGLGILAGDMLRSFADLKIGGVGVTLLSEFGYFTQKISKENNQIEEYSSWKPQQYMDRLEPVVIVKIAHHNIHIRLWRYIITGLDGSQVPIIFLDTNHELNTNEHKRLTQRLYPTNKVFRFLQEIVLGIGGVKALEILGYKPRLYHFNEGHSTLAVLELLKKENSSDMPKALENIKHKCVFTTHTPVPAGHDRFPRFLVAKILDEEYFQLLELLPDVYDLDGFLNMTRLGLASSSKINGVAKRHAEISSKMFPEYPFESVTNGVHHTFWASPSFQDIFTEYIPGWQSDPFKLLRAHVIPLENIELAHQDNKLRLNSLIKRTHNIDYDNHIFTIGYARRITKYKRPDLLFYDINRLNQIAEKYPLQLVFAGKSHVNDVVGKSLIHEILSLQNKLSPKIKFVFLENYDINLAKKIIPGVDLWLNTPMRPLEASGTSGMKASLNGVPNLSVLDGWWLEGHIDGVTGWSIGPDPTKNEQVDECSDCEDSDDMYHKLEDNILPTYYQDRSKYTEIRRNCIAFHGSYFNSHRMVQQYLLKSYLGN